MHVPAGTYDYCKFRPEELLAIAPEVFDGARQQFNAVINTVSSPPQHSFQQEMFIALLEPKSMCGFMELYFNNLTPNRMNMMELNQASLGLAEGLPEHLKKGCDNRPVREFRMVGYHVLSDDEHARANRYIDTIYPYLPSAMALIENGIKGYLAAIDYHVTRPILKDLSTDDEIAYHLGKAQSGLYAGGRVGSLIHEFLPVILQSAAQSAEKLTSQNLAKGMKTAFASRAFKTFTSIKMIDDATPQGYKDIRTCPLKQALGHVMNMVLETQDDGRVAHVGQSSGALLFHAMTVHGQHNLNQMVREAGGFASDDLSTGL